MFVYQLEEKLPWLTVKIRMLEMYCIHLTDIVTFVKQISEVEKKRRLQ
jgi:hypothetical protein